jgi:uncharacterized protein with HEPN domain
LPVKKIRYTSGFTFKEFTRDDEKYDAVLRNLDILGEAVKHVPDDVRNNYPQIKPPLLKSIKAFVKNL